VLEKKQIMTTVDLFKKPGYNSMVSLNYGSGKMYFIKSESADEGAVGRTKMIFATEVFLSNLLSNDEGKTPQGKKRLPS
jgi:hypothetical protein